MNWLDTLDPGAVQAVNFLLLVAEGIGVPGVPFEASMLALGLMSHNGQVELWQAVVWGAVANTLGNLIGYYLGPRGLRLIPLHVQQRFGLTTVQLLMQRRGPWMCVISRWFGPVRTLFIFNARSAGMGWLPYTAYSFIGALTWTAAWQVGLWAGGVAFVELWRQYQLYALLIVALIAIPAYLFYRARKARKKASAAVLEEAVKAVEHKRPRSDT